MKFGIIFKRLALEYPEVFRYNRRWGFGMIEVTRMNSTKIMLNAELIEMVEETPDTVITLTTGKKLIVKESKQEIKDRVIFYKKEIFFVESK